MTNAPWRAIKRNVLPKLPAMLRLEERQFLYWLGQQNTGGAMVDLGTFLGASAGCMAAGAKDAGAKGIVHTYDHFVYGPWCAPYDMGPDWKSGDDTLPFVEKVLAPWKEHLQLHKGDISLKRWSGEPIDALFVDFTQSWIHHIYVTHLFLPYLRIGGVLAHQDYVYVLCYWLHIYMEYYADHFEPISRHIRNSTAAWRYVKPLPAQAFHHGLNEILTFSELLALLDRSIARYEEPWRGVLKAGRVRFFLHALGNEAALEELAKLEVEYKHAPNMREHLDALAVEIPPWKVHEGPYNNYFRLS